MAKGMPSRIGAMIGAGKWTKESRIWIPEIGKEYGVRINELKEQLNLETRAAEDGRTNRPEQDDKTLNEPQLEICNRVFSGILMLNQFLSDQLGVALEGAREKKPAAMDLPDYKSRVTQAISEQFAEHVGELTALRRDDLTAQKDLKYFRSVNKLNRGAHYPDSALKTVGVITALIMIESIANGLLFQEVVPNGLIGGATLALLISILNIVLGLGAGLYGWRNTGHVGYFRKFLGIVFTLIGHGTALFWNVLVAHFRETAAAAAKREDYNFDISELASQSWNHLITHGWFGITSIFAWALLALGIIVHLIAAKEGWDDIEDRYPDYMRWDKRAKDAREDFDQSLVQTRRASRDAADEIVGEAEDFCNESRKALDAISAAQDLAHQREKEVRDSEDEWVTGGTQLLKCYRDTNLTVRDEGTEPRYFSKYPTASDYRTRSFDSERDGTDQIDAHTISAKERLETIAMVVKEGETTVAKNTDALSELRSHVNMMMESLDDRIETAKKSATRDAKEDIRKPPEED